MDLTTEHGGMLPIPPEMLTQMSWGWSEQSRELWRRLVDMYRHTYLDADSLRHAYAALQVLEKPDLRGTVDPWK